jgi:hypothetical protein
MKQYSNFKDRKELFFVFLLCWNVVIIGCQTSERHQTLSTIEVDVSSNGELKLSEYFENFRMLKLPTDSIMGEIQKIQYENNQIFITDGQTMFIFSDEGHLLSCFNKKGQGPGEYTGITDFAVNGETISIINGRRLLNYNHSGKYVSTVNLEFSVMSVSQTVDNTYYLSCGNFLNDKNQHKVHKLREGQEIEHFLPIDEYKSKYLFFFGLQNFCKYQDLVYFFDYFNDTIYISRNEGFEPIFLIDYKGKNIPASYFKRDFADIAVFMTEFHKTSYACGVLDFVLYDRFLMFASRFQQNRKLTVFDRKNEISKTFSTIKDNVYFNGLITSVSNFAYHSDKHIFVPVHAFNVVEWRKLYIMEKQFKEVADVTEEEDNPLLLIFDFKK